MGRDTKIEWAHDTVNPWWGCTKVSPACAHCYAELHDKRFGNHWGDDRPRRYVANWESQLRSFERVAQREGRRRRVFCMSMGDVFEESRPLVTHTGKPMICDTGSVRQALWTAIERCEHLDILLLTKRPQNIMSMVPESWRTGFPDHVWVGATIENQDTLDERSLNLLSCPALVRFLCCEPLLGEVDLSYWIHEDSCGCLDNIELKGPCGFCNNTGAIAEFDWVIAGGESGPKARPMHPDWARSIRDQCEAAGVPFFFKQWGEHVPYEHDAQPPLMHSQHGDTIDAHTLPEFESDEPAGKWVCDYDGQLYKRVGKKRAGRLLDAVEHSGLPEGVTA